MNRADDTVTPDDDPINWDHDAPDDLPAWRTPDDLAADDLIDGILDADLGHRAGKPPPRPPVSADLTDSQRESVARILDGLELPDTGEDREPGESWLPKDLGPALAGGIVRPEPTSLVRNDGRALLYPGRINGLHGDSGVGKGWAALIAATQHLATGGHLLWLDFEDPNEELLVERLRLLGVADTAIAGQVHYVNPQEPAGPNFVDRLLHLATDWPDLLVVIDSTGEALGLNGYNEDKDLEVDQWKRLVPVPFERAGHTVVLVDHSTKAGPGDLHPSGSKRKRALVSGSSWLVEQVKPFSKDTPGTLKLTCAKDRHGNYRRREPGAFVHLDGTTGTVRWIVEAPGTTATDGATVVLMRRVVDLVKQRPEGLSGRAIESELRGTRAVQASHQAIADAIQLAVNRGVLEVTTGARRAQIHRFRRDLTDSDLEDLT